MFQYVVPILGFGFLGLSFLFVFLGFRCVKNVVDRDNPDESVVALSKFFLKIALTFMVVAGPLQWITLAVQYFVEDKEVTLHITMTHPEWKEDQFGSVQIVELGVMHPIINKPFQGSFRDEDEIALNASLVLEKFREIRSQLSEFNNAVTSNELPDRSNIDRMAVNGG